MISKSTLKTLDELYKNGILFVTPSQERMMADPVAAQRMVFSLRTTKKVNTFTTPGFTEISSTPIYGKSRTKLALFNGKYYIINDASEIMTALKLYNGKNILNGYVCDDPEMSSYFKRISKGQKGMSINNLPVSTVKKLNGLTLSFDIVEAKSLEDIITMRKKAFGLLLPNKKIVINNEYTTFFNMFLELAHNLRFNKGSDKKHLPSYWDLLQKNVQAAYLNVAKDINKTNLSDQGILRMLLLSINSAGYNDRIETFGAVNTFNFICSKHTNDSSTKCLDLISNTLLNLSIATKLLDDARLAHPMLWIGCVYNFGQYSSTTSRKKKDRHPTIKLNDKMIAAKKIAFNNALELCLTGHKNTFEKSSLVITQDVSGKGRVFNTDTVDYNFYDVSNLAITADVINAIYNEI